MTGLRYEAMGKHAEENIRTVITDGRFRFWPADGGWRWAFVWPDDGLGSAHRLHRGPFISAVREAREWGRQPR